MFIVVRFVIRMHYNDGGGVLTFDGVYFYHGASLSTADGFGSGTPSW